MAKPSGEKSVWHCLGKGLDKKAGSFVLFSGCKGSALGLVSTTKEKLEEENIAPEEKGSFLNVTWDRTWLKVLSGSETGNNLFESTSLFLSSCWKALFHWICQESYFF